MYAKDEWNTSIYYVPYRLDGSFFSATLDVERIIF